MDRNEKEQVIVELAKAMTDAQVALIADYRGLTVAEVTELRKNLRGVGAETRVVKNTLARLSAKKTLGSGGDASAEFEKFLGTLQGPTMVITCASDPVAPAKVVAQFIKDKQKVQVKGAWLDGKFLDQAAVDSLSKMPGKEETIAKLLALLQTPATQLLRLMSTPGTQVVRVIDAQREKLEKAAA